MTPILRHHRPGDLVAFGGGGPKVASDLLADADKVAASLPPCKPRSHVLLVFESDRYAFAVALMAAWSTGHAVMLPPDGRPQTIGALVQHPDVCGLVHDTRAGGHLQIESILAGPPCTAPPRRPLPTPLATVFTHGIAEPLRPWPKTDAQLFGEVESVAGLFEIAPGGRFVVDVPPTHLFGLVFGLLLPLCTGNAFSRELSPCAQRVAPCIATATADTWVSVPANLRGAETASRRHLSSLRRVFSGTAPLPVSTAQTLARDHGVQVLEAFGFTETGGIAWRNPEQGEPWQPLPGVRTTVDARGHLVVDSPWLASDAVRPWVTAELAEPAQHSGFVHRGRVDEVVHVDGRQVTLSDLQAWLLDRPGVREAELTLVHPPDEDATIVVAIVGPDCDASTLRVAMLEQFDLHPAPCIVLIVDRFERDAIGKLPRRTLLRLFGLEADGRALSTQLELDAPERRTEADVELATVEVRVPTDYVHFEGHFDGYPILAGVVQLHEILLPLVRQVRPELGELQSLQQLKFLGRISPGDAISVTLRFPASSPACDFEIVRGTRRCSAGRLCFSPQEVA